MLNPDSPHYQAEVWIDPENKYDDVDKLSMINSLVQLENVASYSFMKPGLSTAQTYFIQCGLTSRKIVSWCFLGNLSVLYYEF